MVWPYHENDKTYSEKYLLLPHWHKNFIQRSFLEIRFWSSGIDQECLLAEQLSD